MKDAGKNGTVSTKTLVKSGFWYTASSFLTRAVVFLTTPLFTRLLTNEEYGNFTVFASWQSILLIICGLEIYGTINRARFDFQKEEDFNGYITSCLTISTGLTLVLFAFYQLFPTVFYRVLLLDEKYLLIMFGYLFTYPAFAMFQAKQRVEYKYKLNAAISFMLVISSAAMSVVLALLFQDRLYGRIVGQYMPYAVVGAIFYFGFIKKSHDVNLKACRYALRIGLPLVFSFLGSQILLSSDNLILKHMCTSIQVSYLSISHTCAHIILLFVQTLNGAWSPWFYDKLNTRELNTIRKTYSVYIWLIVLATFGVLLFAPELVAILGGAGYHEALYILPANISCGVFTALVMQFVNLETFYKRPEYAAVLTAIVAVLNIGLDILGVRIWNYQAVCYATVLCQVLLVVLHYFVARKMEIRRILPARSLLLVTVSTLLLIPVALLLYQNNTIRWSIIVILLIVMFGVGVIYREKTLLLCRRFLKK